MNLQDIQYITVIARVGSFSRAAEQLLVAQPALSKRVKKIEREYGINLFARSMGSALTLTEEGELFLEMADGMLNLHTCFEERLKHLRSRKNKIIHFGITSHQTDKVVTPLLTLLYKEDDQYFVNIRMGNSKPLEDDVRRGDLDMAMVNTLQRYPDLHYEVIQSLSLGVYLRAGSPAAAKAVHMDGFAAPILRLEDLSGEKFVCNVPGSNSYAYLEKLMEMTNIPLEIIELTNFENRMVMVETGKASFIIPVNWSHIPQVIRKEQLYMLDPSQSITVENCLICRSSFRNKLIYQKTHACLKHIFAQ